MTLVPFATISPAKCQEKPPQKPPAGAHDHSAPQKPEGKKEYPPGIPPVTDEDRAAAFPDLHDRGHAVHDSAVHYYVLFDQLEFQAGDGTGGNWDSRGWIGRDVNRFWFRTEGEVETATSRRPRPTRSTAAPFTAWWDLVAGVRQDFRPGPARTWAAIGIQGLAPYWFEVEATAYIGESGRTHFRIETEYELLLTNRLVLQPLVELEIYGKSDPERRIGAGLSSLETGLRLRYEIRREFAPYFGVTWNRTLLRHGRYRRGRGRRDEHCAARRRCSNVVLRTYFWCPRVRLARNARVTPAVSTNAPTTSPPALMPNARVLLAPGTSTVRCLLRSRTNPCTRAAVSVYTPAISPRGFTSQAAVCVLPGTTKGVKTPSSTVYPSPRPVIMFVNSPTIRLESGVAPLFIDASSSISS